jgi:cyclin-dependent kinase 8/11
MWSLGVTFADFFRPLKQQLDDGDGWGDDYDEEAEEDEQLHTALPFIFLQNPSPSRITSWHRLPLFDAERGDIGLAWSIFKVRGTPNETNWPVSIVNPLHVSGDLILPLGLSVLASC